MVTQIPKTNVSTLNTATNAVRESAQKFNEAAIQNVNAYREAANFFNDRTSELPNESFVETAVQDPVASTVDMLLAETAYKANLEVFKVADELEEEAVNLLA